MTPSGRINCRIYVLLTCPVRYISAVSVSEEKSTIKILTERPGSHWEGTCRSRLSPIASGSSNRTMLYATSA